MASPTAGPWPDEELARLADLVRAGPARAGTTRVVAVDGPSGSGKSVLAQQLSAALRPSAVVRLDDLYPGWDGLDATPQRVLAEVLEPLSRGEEATYRTWDWGAQRYGSAREVPSVPVLLVEGCGSGARVCAPHLTLLVWLDAPPDVRRARALTRDGPTYRPHWERWARQEDVHFAREQTCRRADVRLTT